MSLSVKKEQAFEKVFNFFTTYEQNMSEQHGKDVPD
jgi:hypothetical protein